jgi:hypothetical protein
MDDKNMWIPSRDLAFQIDTDLYKNTTSVSYKYFVSMYSNVLMVGGNELFPVSSFQKFYVAFGTIIGNIINANIFGEMAALLTVVNRRSDEF